MDYVRDDDLLNLDQLGGLEGLSTRFSFNLEILRVNRQIHQEALPLFGWKNNWVRVTSHSRSLADALLDLGSALQLPTYPRPMIGGTDRWAMEISVSLQKYDNELPGMDLAMTVNELDGLVTAIILVLTPPLTVSLKIRKANIFPDSHAANIVKKVIHKLKPLRYIRQYEAHIPYFIVGKDGTAFEKRGEVACTGDGITMATGIRKSISPFIVHCGLIDWKAEEAEMIQWYIRAAVFRDWSLIGRVINGWLIRYAVSGVKQAHMLT